MTDHTRPSLIPLTRAGRIGASIARHSRVREQVAKLALAVTLLAVAFFWIITVAPYVTSAGGVVFVLVPFAMLVGGATMIRF